MRTDGKRTLADLRKIVEDATTTTTNIGSPPQFPLGTKQKDKKGDAYRERNAKEQLQSLASQEVK